METAQTTNLAADVEMLGTLLPAERLLAHLVAAMRFASTDETRPHLSQVAFDEDEGALVVVATNGYSLVAIVDESASWVGGLVGLPIDEARLVGAAIKLAGKAEPVGIRPHSETRVQVNLGAEVATMRTVDVPRAVKFVQWRSVIAGSYDAAESAFVSPTRVKDVAAALAAWAKALGGTHAGCIVEPSDDDGPIRFRLPLFGGDVTAHALLMPVTSDGGDMDVGARDFKQTDLEDYIDGLVGDEGEA